MILDRKYFNFIVQVIDRGYLNTAGGYADSRVLDCLKFLNKGRWGEPNGNCIYEKGPDKGYIGNKYDFHLLTPVGTSRGFEDVDLGNGELHLKGRSKVTPSTNGVLSRDSMELFRVSSVWVLHCVNWRVNRVMVDSRAEMAKPAQLPTPQYLVSGHKGSQPSDQLWSWNRKQWSHQHRSWGNREINNLNRVRDIRDTTLLSKTLSPIEQLSNKTFV